MGSASHPKASATPRLRRNIAPDFSRQAFCIQGLLCDITTLEGAAQTARACMRAGRRCNIITPNANFLRMARSDSEFRDALLANDLSLIDGTPLVWFARALGAPASERVCGSDLFETLMGHSGERFRAFFFGATDDIGRRLRQQLGKNSSGIQCAGTYAPGFGSVDSMSNPGIFERINAVHPDLLVVSVGARKGVLWLNRNERLLSAPVICNLGATVNFVARTVKRAPPLFRRHGLEWLWRIKEEPTLWTRYARDLATLTSVLIWQILPCIAATVLHRALTRQITPCQVRHHKRGTAEILEFYGVWTRHNLAPVRAALTEATRTTSDLVVDLDGVTLFDAAFLGQILLAYGYQRRMRLGFEIHASRAQIRRLLRLNGCAFLIPADQRTDRRRWSLHRPASPKAQNSEGAHPSRGAFP